MDVRVTGLVALEKKLTALPTKVARKVIRQALRKGAKPVKASVKTNAVAMVGGEMGSLIAKATAIRAVGQRPGRASVGVVLTAKYNDDFVHIAKDGKRSYIPSAIEFGHTGPGGGEKVTPANPFARRAWHTQKPKALSIIQNALRAGVEREAQM